MANLFPNLDFFAEIRVSKNPGLAHGFSKNFPPHGFPTPWILDFRGGRGSGRQKPRLDAKAESPGCLKAAG